MDVERKECVDILVRTQGAAILKSHGQWLGKSARENPAALCRLKTRSLETRALGPLNILRWVQSYIPSRGNER